MSATHQYTTLDDILKSSYHTSMTSRFIVYGLVDPRSLEIRYVGKSSSGLDRPKAHRHPCNLKKACARNVWLRELFSAGLNYGIVILESISDPKMRSSLCWWQPGHSSRLSDTERWWIAYGRCSGWNILNTTDGGGGVAYHKQTDLQKERKQVSALKGTNNPATFPEVREKIRQSKLGKKRSPETCRAISEAHLKSPAVRENIVRMNIIRWGDDWTLKPCGTDAAWQRADRANRRGLPSCGPCVPCVEAHLKYRRKYSKAWDAKQKHNRTAQQSAEIAVARHNSPEVQKHVQRMLKLRWGEDWTPSPCGTNAAWVRANRSSKLGRESCGPCVLCVEARHAYQKRFR